jgi:hypothetical protein
MELRHGARVRCKIRGYVIDDAKLSYFNSWWYICQNVVEGSSAQDKLGYAYSWTIQQGTLPELVREGVTEFAVLPECQEMIEREANLHLPPITQDDINNWIIDSYREVKV